MNSYKDISVWENSRRLQGLKKFRDDVVIFFDNRHRKTGGDLVEESAAVEARQRINFAVDQAHGFVKAAGITPTLIVTSPLLVRPGRLDVIFNLFELHEFEMSEKQAIDIIERAIGVYQSDRMPAWYRTVNPLWWLWRGFLWFAQIPFFVLGAVGFDVTRAEESVLGKLFKVIFALVTTTVAALLTILHLMGWLPAVKTLLGIK